MTRALTIVLVLLACVSCPEREPRLRVIHRNDVGRFAYVGLSDHSSFYKIDRDSGDVWVCKGEVLEAWASAVNWDGKTGEIIQPDEPLCKGLDGFDFAAPIISSPRMGSGLSHNPPRKTEWESLNFCDWWRTAAGHDRAAFCKAAAKPFDCDLCPDLKK